MSSQPIAHGTGAKYDIALSVDAAARGGFLEATRTNVLWIGGDIPHDLDIAVRQKDRYHWVAVPLDANAVDAAAPRARALILDLPPDIPDALEWARGVLSVAYSHDLTVIITRSTADMEGVYESSSAQVAFYKAARSVVDPSSGRAAAFWNAWHQVADRVAKHHPGPGSSGRLELIGDVPEDREARILLRRAFHDLKGVALEELTGGKSGAGVYIASPGAADRGIRALPFLVKLNSREKMSSERSYYDSFAHQNVSFRLRPQLHPTRCVQGNTRGLLVFDFIERAISFRAALRSYPAGQLVGSLFDHTLAGCLATGGDTHGQLETHFTRVRALNWSDDLVAAAALAAVTTPELPSVDALRALLTSLPAVPHRTATAHGDLHTGNLLVAAGSTDVLLIDFGSIGAGMPIVTDFACLEVSVAFPPADVASELDRACSPADEATWLRDAYRYPLEAYTVPRLLGKDGWLSDTLRAVRGAARQHESNPAPYAIAVAAYLIRYASYSDNGSLEDRALAYELACHLVDSVSISLGVETGAGNDGAGHDQ